MASALFILAIITVISAQTIVDIPIGSNYTLIGPTTYTEVIWCRLSTEDYYNVFCDGDDDIQVTCDKQNLTLINVTQSYSGYFYGYDRYSSEFKNYMVRIIQPINANTKMEKLHMNNTLNLTISPTTPSEQNIPNSMIAIIVAVAVGMAIIIACMLIYACCYKKFRREKQDPLLNYDF